MEKYIRPDRTSGLRHLALNVINFESSVDFYTRLLGMEVEWQPDADNFYLTSGNDNLALHRVDANDEIVKQSFVLSFVIPSNANPENLCTRCLIFSFHRVLPFREYR